MYYNNLYDTCLTISDFVLEFINIPFNIESNSTYNYPELFQHSILSTLLPGTDFIKYHMKLF